MLGWQHWILTNHEKNSDKFHDHAKNTTTKKPSIFGFTSACNSAYIRCFPHDKFYLFLIWRIRLLKWMSHAALIIQVCQLLKDEQWKKEWSTLENKPYVTNTVNNQRIWFEDFSSLSVKVSTGAGNSLQLSEDNLCHNHIKNQKDFPWLPQTISVFLFA